jgi:acetyl-CoA carboxylase carboxyltransferase component
VDQVILPSETRRRLCDALSTLDGIAQPTAGVRNIPL